MEPEETAVETVRTEPSIKRFIRHLNNRIESLKSDLQVNQNECKSIKTEAGIVETQTSEACNEIMNSTLDALERLNKDFKKLQHEERTEDTFLKQQLGALNQEKTKLEQSVVLLTTRVGGSESDVGVTLRLPEVSD